MKVVALTLVLAVLLKSSLGECDFMLYQGDPCDELFDCCVNSYCYNK